MAQTEKVERDLVEEFTVYDVETHPHSDNFPMLLEYVENERLKQQMENGYVFGPDEWGPIPWDGWDRSAGGNIQYEVGILHQAEDYDEKREEFGVDTVIYSPGTGFKIVQIPNRELRIEMMRAMNRYTADRFARGDGTNYAKIHILPDHPQESLEEIEKYADNDGFVGTFFTGLLDYPMGHPRHDPLFEAAERYDLPFFLHGESSVYPGFPTDGFKLGTFMEVHTLVHPMLQLWHATSLIGEEVPERYDIDVCFLEAGQSWVQMLGSRMDREYIERPLDAPGLNQLPSDYLSEFYYGTQPLEEPRDPERFGDQLEMMGIEDSLVLTTDYPHMDFDATSSILDHEGLTFEQKKKILHDNPESLLGI